jgi:hypothetical protein
VACLHFLERAADEKITLTMPGRDGESARTRWLGVGRSNDTSPATAAADAVGAAITGDDPKLLIAFCSESYNLPALAAELDAAGGGIPLIGASTAGEIAASGPGDSSVVVTAIGGPGFEVATGVGRNASADLRAAGASAARCAESLQDRSHRVLMLLTDGLAGDQSEIVRGAHAVAGAGIPLVGGCAGDDSKMERTHQLYGGEALTDAVVAAAIASDAPVGIGCRHGWRHVGEPVLVTASDHGNVYSLDDEPALDVYLDRLDAPGPPRADPDQFIRFAQTHPLGLSRKGAESQVRFISGADFEQRSLQTIAELPQGAIAWFMEGDQSSVLDATDAACGDALAPLGGHDPIGMIGFDCIARRGVLGDTGIRAEIDRLVERVGEAPIAGFYTYGEIARTSGVSGFHNQTLVVLALA